MFINYGRKKFCNIDTCFWLLDGFFFVTDQEAKKAKVQAIPAWSFRCSTQIGFNLTIWLMLRATKLELLVPTSFPTYIYEFGQRMSKWSTFQVIPLEGPVS